MCVLEITPVIATERLMLRGVVANDAQRLCDLANDLMVARMTRSLPHPYGMADAETWLERTVVSGETAFVIEHRLEGMVGLLSFDPSPRREIGYFIGRRYWNQGYATEAVQGALAWLARQGQRMAAAGHFSDNPASGIVLCKAGFLYTGEVQLRPSIARSGDLVPTRMMVWLA